ncbi:MAG: hypothetical protein L3K03_03205 [Thermoplasmata archaeon]|nr:hypothetical protein [Thermoplasmata archaeon]
MERDANESTSAGDLGVGGRRSWWGIAGRALAVMPAVAAVMLALMFFSIVAGNFT